MEFNKRSRQANALLASSSGILLQAVQIFGNFFYRTVFLLFLTQEHLGINGLFTNVLQLFSLAELGIGSAILYSMYKPFAEHNVGKIGALIRFYQKIYTFLAVLVIGMGAALYPFLHHLIDISQVPSDVNLTVIYFLFVIRSATSYLFVYKQSLMTADQQSHKVSLFNCGLQIGSYAIKILILFLTKDFHLVLMGEIVLSLILNYLFSRRITKKYAAVFESREKLDKIDRNQIFTHTFGLLFHKLGYIVVTSTDSFILSKYVSLAAVGLYSNYAMIVTAITNLMSKVLSALVPTIANYVINKSTEDSHTLFRRTLFINLWLSCLTTVCLYLLLGPFITLWLGENFLLPQAAVLWICLQHYLQTARMSTNTFINSCGLFHLDRFRPLVESVLNLAISIILVQRIGIAGVFIGTVVSGLCTYFWREPYLLYTRFFKRGMLRYFLIQLLWLALTAAICLGGHFLFSLLGGGLLHFILMAAMAAIIPNVLILLCTFRTDSGRFVLGFIAKKIPFLKKKN